MSMTFDAKPHELKRCPECRSSRLVISVYRDSAGRVDSRALECEGCYSVVRELTDKQVKEFEKTENGKKILARASLVQ